MIAMTAIHFNSTSGHVMINFGFGEST